MMSFKCSIHLKIVFIHFKVSFDTVFMCKNGVKYQYVSLAVWAYEHVFWKHPGGSLIGACTLIRMSMVYVNCYQIHSLIRLLRLHTNFVFLDLEFCC